MQLTDELLSEILDQLPIKDKFKKRIICHRFNRLLTRLIAQISSLHLKQMHLCEWANAKFNELNTLNLSNINQINKLLGKFNRIERLKLKLNCSHLLDYRQLNSFATINLRELYLLVNCDSIYTQIIYLQIQNVECLTIYCNQYDHLDKLFRQISFLNHFKRLQYFSSNLRHCCCSADHQANGQLYDQLSNHHPINQSNPINQINQSNHCNQPNRTSNHSIYGRPPNQQSSMYGSVQTLQLRNHMISNLHYSHLIIDTYDHLDLLKSFTKLQKLALLSIREEYLEKFVHQLPYLTHLVVHHLSTHFIELEHLFKSLGQFRLLRYLNLTIHQLNFDLQLRLLLTDFLSKSKSKVRLVLNSFEIKDLNDLNQFQRFLTILPSRIKQTFSLKHLTGDELDLNYCSNLVLNKFVYGQIRSLTIKKFQRANHLRNISVHLTNLHYLEIRDYFGDTDELILALLASNLSKLKTMKLIKVNIVNVNTILHITKWKNLIHLEIQLKYFMHSNGINGHQHGELDGNRLNGHKNSRHKAIQIKHLTNNGSFDDGLNIEKQLINNFYSFAKLDKLQKLILGKFKLTTSLLLYLLDNCTNLYLVNVDNCSNVDHHLLQNAIRNKFTLNSIQDR